MGIARRAVDRLDARCLGVPSRARGGIFALGVADSPCVVADYRRAALDGDCVGHKEAACAVRGPGHEMRRPVGLKNLSSGVRVPFGMIA